MAVQKAKEDRKEQKMSGHPNSQNIETTKAEMAESEVIGTEKVNKLLTFQCKSLSLKVFMMLSFLLPFHH